LIKQLLDNRSHNGYSIKEVFMRQVSLREFRTRGEVALKEVPKDEVVLLSGQKGPAYFLIPAHGDLTEGDRELRRVMAKMSLYQYGKWAVEQGLDQLSPDNIDEEIRSSRLGRKKAKECA
jgi:hypothetical protein